ncbi:Protein of unknown function (DUF3570) [Shewanella psychrophila]|uniref:DUF3570 domain-containing protein n=1 Tax=Shewanella psychrophila TaxID=225848 RepID=A0A1S6HK61_9GAMM|nr:Protein of unknown function (DUF3570) [Shewanella psychrophila]
MVVGPSPGAVVAVTKTLDRTIIQTGTEPKSCIESRLKTANFTSEPSIYEALSAASFALLGMTSSVAIAAETSPSDTDETDSPKIDAALLYYQEQDRVTVAEGIFNLKLPVGDKRVYEGKLVLDTLTGSSANGAVAQDERQTFTRPSGNGEYNIDAGIIPLDDTFKDTRVQISGNWAEIWSPDWSSNHGVYLSREYDYTSLGINSALERSFNKNNTQLSLGMAYYYDLVDPVGGRPVAMSKMVFRDDFESQAQFRTEFDKTREIASTDKQTVDLSVGLTQIINRYMLVQLSYNLSSLKGYMTDPYKVLSLVDASGTSEAYLYESRPDERLKQSLYLFSKHALSTGVTDLAYRYSSDDWGVSSHTFETRYRYKFTSSFFGQLHLRYYQQEAASFYRAFLNSGEVRPEFASADYRIGNMNTYTLGVKIGHTLIDGTKASYRLEYYQQDPYANGDQATGQLAHQELYPSLKAIIFQLGLSF